MEKKYRVNEIFYSLQGEGAYSGVPMIFVRFSGCNLKCHFCDTDHSSFMELSAHEIREIITKYPCKTVCITGGEPTLQITEELIATAFQGYEVHLETNGTNPIPKGVDWITVSPKAAPVVIDYCHEIKLLYGQGCEDPKLWENFNARVWCLQPIDVAGDPTLTAKNVQDTIEYCKQHPQWRLSLQTHKFTHIK